MTKSGLTQALEDEINYVKLGDALKLIAVYTHLELEAVERETDVVTSQWSAGWHGVEVQILYRRDDDGGHNYIVDVGGNWLGSDQRERSAFLDLVNEYRGNDEPLQSMCLEDVVNHVVAIHRIAVPFVDVCDQEDDIEEDLVSKI